MQGGQAGTYSETFGVEFQTHVLAVLSRTPTAIGRYRSALDHRFFVSEIARAVAKALLTHYDQFQKNPTVTTLIEDVRSEVGDDKFSACEKFTKKLFTEDISDADAVLRKVVDFGKQQAMVNAVIECAEFIEKGERNKIRPRIETAQLIGEDLLNIGIDYTANPNRAAWYSVDPTGDKIPTGLVHLDYALGGGLGRGELGVVLAPPKRGKTSTLINFGFGALTAVAAQSAGYNVVHYTLEMREKKVGVRYDDRLAGKYHDLRKADPKLYQQRMEERSKTFLRGQLFIKEYSTRSATVSMVRSHLTMLIGRGFTPDMAIVDYADIMKPERRLGELRHEQAGVYEDLRTLAGDLDIAVWTGSQAPRGALEKETLDLGDFAESFEKAAVMDVGVAFCQTDDEKVDSRCRLFLIGVRDAEDNRAVECTINRKRCMLKTTQLLDVAKARIPTPYDTDSVSTTPRTIRQKTVSAVKQEAGITRKSSPRKVIPGQKSGPVKRPPPARKGPTKIVPKA